MRTTRKYSLHNGHANPSIDYNMAGLLNLLESASTHHRETIDMLFGEILMHVSPEQLPDLKECACISHNRTTTSRRNIVENRIINWVKQRYPSRDKTINYLSLGSGLLLQDFIICAKLLIDGYSLCVRLIEPKCEHFAFTQAYEQFCCLQLFASGLGLKFTASYFPSVIDYIETHSEEKIAVGHATDFDVYHLSDHAKIDLHLACQLIAKRGFFYFGMFNFDLIFTHSIIACLRDPTKRAEFIKDMETVNRAEKEITAFLPPFVAKYILNYSGLLFSKNNAAIAVTTHGSFSPPKNTKSLVG